MVVESCNFTGIKVDSEMVQAVVSVANAAEANAKAIHQLAKSLDLSNVQVGPMIKMELPKDES